MTKFLCGLIVGSFLTILIYFSPYIDPRFRISIGQILDKDAILLKNGRIIEGRIFKETDREIFIEVKNGYFSISRSDCDSIEKNYILRFVRELI